MGVDSSTSRSPRPYDQPAMSDHLLIVDKSVDGRGWVLYRGRCTCDWTGPWQSSKGHAARQHQRHLQVQGGPPSREPAPARESAGPPARSSEDEVRAEYRRRIKEVHPDHGGSVEDALRVIAEYEASRRDED